MAQVPLLSERHFLGGLCDSEIYDSEIYDSEICDSEMGGGKYCPIVNRHCWGG